MHLSGAAVTAALLAGALSLPAAASAYVDTPVGVQAVGDPVVSILTGPPALSNAEYVDFTFSADDDNDGSLDLVCTVDGVPLDACDPDGTRVEAIDDGSHTFVVSATDDDLHTGSDSYDFELDRSAPPASLDG